MGDDSQYLVIVAPTLPRPVHARSARPAPFSASAPRRKRSLTERLSAARPALFTGSRRGSTPSDGEDKSFPGPGLPDLRRIRAFVAYGSQAVPYAPGTWHAPMVVLGTKAIDFVVVQYANGVSGEDCQELGILPAPREDEGVIVLMPRRGQETQAVDNEFRSKL